jgi:hypothetical protein
MSTTTSTIAIAALVVGFGGAASALSGHRTETMPRSPVQQAVNESGMCAIAASFSANPAMANDIRRAASCGQVSASR